MKCDGCDMSEPEFELLNGEVKQVLCACCFGHVLMDLVTSNEAVQFSRRYYDADAIRWRRLPVLVGLCADLCAPAEAGGEEKP